MKNTIIYIFSISLFLYLGSQQMLLAQNDNIYIDIDIEETIEAFKNKQKKKTKTKPSNKQKDGEKKKHSGLKERKNNRKRTRNRTNREVGRAPNGYDLAITTLNCPTTVTMGERITISGYLTNYGSEAYDDRAIRLGFQVQEAPMFLPLSDVTNNFDIQSADADFTDLLYPLVKVVTPSQNVYFEETIEIDPAYFAKGKNIVIIWPTKVEVNDADNSNNYIVKEIYVE